MQILAHICIYIYIYIQMFIALMCVGMYPCMNSVGTVSKVSSLIFLCTNWYY